MLIVIKEQEKVVVGVSICDSSVDMSEKDLALEENIPLWKVTGEKDCYVCMPDLSQETDVLMYNSNIFKGITDGQSIIEKVLPKMKELLRKNDLLLSDREWDSQVIIIKAGKVFRISNFFCVSEAESHEVMNFNSIISGAIDVNADIDSVDRILSAVRFANRMMNKQYFPITIFDTKSKRRKVYYK